MGYLLSSFTLSKAATDRWLTTSEILLLVAGLILTWGALGEYLADHNKLDRLPRRLRWSKLVFILMVVGGLVGEFLGDGGVFVFSYRLQSIEDAELERLGADANKLEKRLKLVDDASNAAGTAAGIALDNSGKAVSSSTTALNAARAARNEVALATKAQAALSAEIDAQGPRWFLIFKLTPQLVEDLKPFKGQRCFIASCNNVFPYDTE